MSNVAAALLVASVPAPASSTSHTSQPWDSLRRFTDARIALGRAGHSLPTAAHLQFQLAHAQARDAVHVPLDTDRVVHGLQALGFETLKLHSAAPSRHVYLQRPDLGRRLDEAACRILQAWREQQPEQQLKQQREQQSEQDLLAPSPDVCFVVADGLSALAIHNHAIEFLQCLLPHLQRDAEPWRVAPVCLVEQGRVAIGDDIAERLAAKLVVVLIGERPGLSSPDSMGIYVTWAPRVGCTDAQRNCISNVRGAGLAPQAAALQLHQLMSQAHRLKLTGVGLKPDTLALDAGA
jgi:ethanolamine ammonia-lyase small subunit